MDEMLSGSGGRARVVVVGGGFAGLFAMRKLQRLLPPDAAELVLVSPTDHLLYSPLLPDVTASVVEPRHIAVSLRQALRRTRIVLGHTRSVDRDARTVEVRLVERDAGTAEHLTISWDRLVLAPGSVTRSFPIPGVAEHARGVKTLTEAVFVRDHLLTQLDLADSLPEGPEHDAERRERMTVVAVGAGYTGTEIVALTQRWLKRVATRYSRIDPADVRWVFVDIMPKVLPELGDRLGTYGLQALRGRGIDIRLGVSVESVDDRTVHLTDGTAVPSRTLLWNAGIAANPLVGTLGLPLERGRLVVDAQMRATDGIWAVGDAAAVPDLAKETAHDGPQPVTPPTAQHAQRQGAAVARNVAASLGHGTARDYRHKDLGLVADLGGTTAVARPLGVELTGLPAKVVARGYHLYALPSTSNRVRVLTDWVLHAVLPVQAVSPSVIRSQDALVPAAQSTEIYADAVPAPRS